jgi:uncharacterized radical SAM superfamily protein
MPNLAPQTLWNLKDTDFLDLLDRGTFKPIKDNIRFYAPSFSYYKTKHFCASTKAFPTISVTGNACALNCGHCGGKVLETMHSATSPEELYTLASKLKAEGASGCLVSGGCLPDGSVPLDDFVDVLGRLKRELGLTMFVHTGIISAQTAVGLKDAGVDAALIDVIGSQQTIRKVYNLNVSVTDYAKSLKTLHEAGLRVVPHVIVGLNEGKLDGEYHALELTSQIQPAALVIIAFMPIRGTTMAKTTPPRPIDIAKVAASARLMFPQTPLTLGCMRPKGAVRSETDVLALKAGVDAVAFPSDTAVEYAKTLGYQTVFSSFCCAQIYADSASK